MQVADKKKFNDIVADVSNVVSTSFFNVAAKYDTTLDGDTINGIHQGLVTALADCAVKYHMEVIAKLTPGANFASYVNNVQKDFSFIAMKFHAHYKKAPKADGFVTPKKGSLQ